MDPSLGTHIRNMSRSDRRESSCNTAGYKCFQPGCSAWIVLIITSRPLPMADRDEGRLKTDIRRRDYVRQTLKSLCWLSEYFGIQKDFKVFTNISQTVSIGWESSRSGASRPPPKAWGLPLLWPPCWCQAHYIVASPCLSPVAEWHMGQRFSSMGFPGDTYILQWATDLLNILFR